MLCPLILISGTVVTALADPVPGQGTWDDPQLGLQERDINGDGVADAFFDPALNISWLAEASQFLGNWDNAMAWAAGLEVYGVTGWRLPTLAAIADSCDSPPSPDSSEWTHIFFVTLGNSKSCGGGISALTNTGPFNNLMDDEAYWSATDFPEIPTGARDFFTYFGTQSGHDKWINLYGWAVHDGDVGALLDPGILLQRLADATVDIGSGKSLTKKVELAQTYYAVPDVQSTCAVLTDFADQVTSWSTGKKPKLEADQAASLTADAWAIMDAIHCD